MAYNSYFPMGYQPYYPQMAQPQAGGQMSQPNNGGLTWVQGESGAKSYLVAPNQTVTLWDSEANVIYLKSADASGMPSIRILDYTMRDTAQRQPDVKMSGYATMDEIKRLQNEINALKERLGDESFIYDTADKRTEEKV